MSFSPDAFQEKDNQETGKWQAASAGTYAAAQKSEQCETAGIKTNYTTKRADCHPVPPSSPLPCDSHHHHYHYQASAQYLWLAHTQHLLGHKEEARRAYDKAIFQDHFNEPALAGRNRLLSDAAVPDDLTAYAKHPLLDADFCSAIEESVIPATELHDRAVIYFQKQDYMQALQIVPVNEHSNGRFLRGKCLLLLGRSEEAVEELSHAIRLSHISHDAYHRFASAQHCARAEQWLAAGDIELAISGFTKALDLFSGNQNARRLRAQCYHSKGNQRLAEADEACIS